MSSQVCDPFAGASSVKILCKVVEFRNVEVKLELGHRASIRSKPTTEGFTHDWVLFVRSPEGCNIHHFVEKVVFILHESFPKPKRVLKEPPYNVKESGYAGFNLSIEVYFRNKEDPKKVHFDYDLYLHLEGPPIQNSRMEKLTFQNPNQEFRKKLLKGGGVAISAGSQNSNSSTCNTSNNNPVQTETEQPSKSKPLKGSNEGPKKTPKVKLPNVPKEVPTKVPEAPNHPFTHIFGAPIKTKPSPDASQKSKDIAKEKSSSGSSKTTTSATTNTSSSSSSSPLSSSLLQNNIKTTSKEPQKTSSNKEKLSTKSVNKETEKKEVKPTIENNNKTLKRSSSPSQGHKLDESTNKKRKRSTSTSSATSSTAEKTSSNKDKKAKPKEKEQHKKEHKVVTPPVLVPPKKETQKQSKPTPAAPRKEPRELKSPVANAHNENDQESISSTGRARHNSESSDSSSSSPEEKDVKADEVESQSSIGSASSPSSSLTLSSINPGSTHGPLATMMAQMEQELVSPLSSDQGSPAHSVASPEPEKGPVSSPSSPETPPAPVKVEEPPNKKKEKRHIEKSLPATTNKKVKEEPESCPPPPPVPPSQPKSDGKQQPIDAAYLRELMQLQERIMALRDKHHLQRIVDVIEETGLYQITSSSIDFDLCALDRSTVQKLQNCMTVT